MRSFGMLLFFLMMGCVSNPSTPAIPVTTVEIPSPPPELRVRNGSLSHSSMQKSSVSRGGCRILLGMSGQSRSAIWRVQEMNGQKGRSHIFPSHRLYPVYRSLLETRGRLSIWLPGTVTVCVDTIPPMVPFWHP